MKSPEVIADHMPFLNPVSQVRMPSGASNWRMDRNPCLARKCRRMAQGITGQIRAHSAVQVAGWRSTDTRDRSPALAEVGECALQAAQPGDDAEH